jgi:hypothetical protein
MAIAGRARMKETAELRKLIKSLRRCPLFGVKRTLIEYAAMSAFDPKRTSIAEDRRASAAAVGTMPKNVRTARLGDF